MAGMSDYQFHTNTTDDNKSQGSGEVINASFWERLDDALEPAVMAYREYRATQKGRLDHELATEGRPCNIFVAGYLLGQIAMAKEKE